MTSSEILENKIFERIEYIPFHQCWEWIGNKTKKGYGVFSYKEKTIVAHRFIYEFYKSKIKEGLTIDHLCKNVSCVNPEHLEAVSYYENNYRSNCPTGINSRKTFCKRGHIFDHKNTYKHISRNGRYSRICRKCQALYQRKRRGNYNEQF